jgi:hypothetical protein
MNLFRKKPSTDLASEPTVPVMLSKHDADWLLLNAVQKQADSARALSVKLKLMEAKRRLKGGV